MNVGTCSDADCGVVIEDVPVSVTYTGDPDVDGAALAAAITASAPASVFVTCEYNPGSMGVVLLYANTTNYPGTAGNAITLVPIGTGVTVSDDTLEGGQQTALPCGAAFQIELQHIAETRPSPADMKTSREIDLHFRNRSFRKATLELSSDLVTTPQDTDFYPAQTVAQAAAGTVPDYTADTSLYPGAPVRPKKTRLGVGQVVARASYLNIGFKIREAYALWTLNGTTVVESPVSEKGQR